VDEGICARRGAKSKENNKREPLFIREMRDEPILDIK
jgi:hypothetical protein